MQMIKSRVKILIAIALVKFNLLSSHEVGLTVYNNRNLLCKWHDIMIALSFVA